MIDIKSNEVKYLVNLSIESLHTVMKSKTFSPVTCGEKEAYMVAFRMGYNTKKPKQNENYSVGFDAADEWIVGLRRYSKISVTLGERECFARGFSDGMIAKKYKE